MQAISAIDSNYLGKLNLGLPKLVKQLLLVTVLLGMTMLANGQGETTSAIVGTVVDPTGAPIAGATVTVTSADNGMIRSAKTDSAGRFSFPQLKPGLYVVKAAAEHFEPQENKSVTAALGQKQTVDFALSIAKASQSVTVREDASLIQPENPNTSTTLSARALRTCPTRAAT